MYDNERGRGFQLGRTKELVWRLERPRSLHIFGPTKQEICIDTAHFEIGRVRGPRSRVRGAWRGQCTGSRGGRVRVLGGLVRSRNIGGFAHSLTARDV